MKAGAAVGLILILSGLVFYALVNYQVISPPPIDGNPPPPPPPVTFPIAVVGACNHLIGGPTPVLGIRVYVEETGGNVTTVNTLTPSQAPTVRLSPGYSYTIVATTFHADGKTVVTQLTKVIVTPTTLSSNYEIYLEATFQGFEGYPPISLYALTLMELRTWT